MLDDNQAFVTGTKEVVQKVNNKSFFNSFFQSKKIINRIGYFGQALSAITEFLFIYLALGGSMPVFKLSNVLPVLAGLAAVYIFEVLGIRIILVKIIRQAVRKDFDTWQKKTLFGFLVAFCLVIGFANFWTSIKGQKVSFFSAKMIDNSGELAALDSLERVQVQEVKDRYTILNGKLDSTATTKKDFINSTYASSITELNKSKWVEGANKARINNKINTKNDEKETKIDAIDQQLVNDKFANDTLQNSEIASIKSFIKTKKDGIKKGEKGQLNILSIVEGFTLTLLIIFIIISIASIVYVEVFLSGADAEIEVIEIKKRPNLFLAFWFGVYNKIYHSLYKLVVKFVGTEAFNYSKLIVNKTDLYSTDVVSPVQVSAKSTRTQVAGFSAKKQNQPVAVQTDTTVSDANKNAIVSKYNFNTLASAYKRSDLVKKSLSKNKLTQERNRIKYLEAKAELEKVGVKFIERKNNVTIKL